MAVALLMIVDNRRPVNGYAINASCLRRLYLAVTGVINTCLRGFKQICQYCSQPDVRDQLSNGLPANRATRSAASR